VDDWILDKIRALDDELDRKKREKEWAVLGGIVIALLVSTGLWFVIVWSFIHFL
jgi:hypothetical protein